MLKLHAVMKLLFSFFSRSPIIKTLALIVCIQLLAFSVAPDAHGLGFRLRGSGFNLSVGQGEIESEIDTQLQPIEKVFGGASETSLAETIAKVIRAVLGLLGVIFIALIIYAGFMWLTSAGNEDRIKKAKMIIVAAIIGVAIILFAFIITNFVFNTLLEVSYD